MSDALKPIFLLKPAEDRVSILANRTINVITEDDSQFIVLVTDRDYLDDPTGQTQTIVFRRSCESIQDAEVEMQKQVGLSLEEGLIHNKLAMI